MTPKQFELDYISARLLIFHLWMDDSVGTIGQLILGRIWNYLANKSDDFKI